MSTLRTERSVAMNGTGSGPTLSELARFVEQAGHTFSGEARVRFSARPPSDQREGSSWRLEIKESS